MLKILIFLPLIGLITNVLFFRNLKLSRCICLIISILEMYIALWLLITINFNNNEYQYRDFINLYYFRISMGIDGINLSLILLTTIIFPIIILILGKVYKREDKVDFKLDNNIINILYIMLSLLMFIFLSLDIFIFFLMFEFILIPMFILIGKFGNLIKGRIEASYRFILYTIMGSLFMLLSIIFIYIKFGTTHNELLNIKIINELYNNNIFILKLLWCFIFFSFIIKIPIFPFHTWLPEAHSEAPTIGSIILAGILLKLGTFGILRYSLYIFSPLIYNSLNIISYFLPFLSILSILSIIYCSISTIRQIDLKKIIAYSSIVHMNFSIFGFFSNDIIGLTGSSYLMFSHAFISSALFLLVGILYKRYHSRIINYYRGLFFTMPIFSSFFLLFSFANMSLPLSSSFIAELFILISSLKSNFFISFILSISLIFSTSYVIWLTNRILFGSISSYLSSTQSYSLDLSLNEFLSLLPLFFFTFFFGICTQPLISILTLSLINLLN